MRRIRLIRQRRLTPLTIPFTGRHSEQHREQEEYLWRV